jgi:methylmalonyl-CoA mutase cobalamin-binding domain/chain
VVGLSILSGSHAELIPAVLGELAEAGADVPVVVGGIIAGARLERVAAVALRRHPSHGSSTRSRVPAPGALSSSSVPPTASTRSAIP